MAETVCELIVNLVGDPSAARAQVQVQARQAEVLAHLDACDACHGVLEGAADIEAVFEVLAVEETLAPGDRAMMDRLVVADNDDKIRAAVRESLVPGLGGQARKIAEQYDDDPLKLYAATEAVSLLLRRALPVRESGRAVTGIFSAGPMVSLFADGSAKVRPGRGLDTGGPAFESVSTVSISPQGMATEIARFTDLWESRGDTRVPSARATELAGWVFLAAQDQRRLLRHFSVAPSILAARGLTLLPLAASARVDNPYERWHPEASGLDEKVWIAIPQKLPQWFEPAVPAPHPGYVLVGFAPATLMAGGRYQQFVDAIGSTEDCVAFVAHESLLQRVRPIAAPIGQVRIGTAGFDLAALEPEFVGVVEDVDFRERGVALSTTRSTVHVAAERIVLPVDLG